MEILKHLNIRTVGESPTNRLLQNLTAPHSRFLISVHQSDVTIAYCEFSMEYLSYIYSEQRPQHLPYITMHRSRKYDLCDSTERRLAAQAIVALAEYFNSSV